MGTEIFVIQRCQLLKEKEKAFLMKEFTLKKQLIIIKSMFYYCYIIFLCNNASVYWHIFQLLGFHNICGHQFSTKNKIPKNLHYNYTNTCNYTEETKVHKFLKKNIISFIFQKSQDFNVA